MINEVIQEILAAEKQAQEIKDKAENTALEISLSAQKKSEGILSDAVILAKQERERIAENSRQTAEQNYLKITGEQIQAANALANEKGELADKIGEEIFGRI